jgi:hypothetical protein
VYTSAPTFYLSIELRDIIGQDLWSNLATQLESFLLAWSGFTIVGTEGVGTKKVTIKFQPPWSEHSPIAIMFGATRNFIAALAILIIGIVVTLVVLRISFGEVGGAVLAGGGLLILGVIALAFMRVKIPKREETK